VATGATDVLPKKEVLRLGHEREKLERNLGGIRDMTRLPAAVWVVDTRKEHIAVTEARKLGIPVVAILDTNCDPDEVDYPIPGNDDAIRAGSLLTRIVADAVAEGLRLRSVYASEGAGKEGAAAISASPADEEPLAEWERELLESESGDQAETARFGRTDEAAASATPSADQPASSGRSGAQGGGGRGATQSRSGARSAGQGRPARAAAEATAEAGATQPEAATEAAEATEDRGAATEADSRGPAGGADSTDTSSAGDSATAAGAEGADTSTAEPQDTTPAESEVTTDAEGEGAAGAESDDTANAESEATTNAEGEGSAQDAAEVAADPTNETREPRA
jgi:hypothetical protein